MFTNEQKNAWRNLKTPDDLFLKTQMKLEETKRNTFKYTSLVSIVAALLLVVGVYFFGFSSTSNVDVFCGENLLTEEAINVSVYDKKMLIYSRMLPTMSVDFQLDCDAETELFVESGILSVFSDDGTLISDGNKVRGEGNIHLVWSGFDFSESDFLTLTVKNKRQEYVVILSCTDIADICTVKCIRK